MEKEVLIIEARRQGYSIPQCGNSITVGEMIAFLSQYNDDAEIYLSHDNGYTYGAIHEGDMSTDYINEED